MANRLANENSPYLLQHASNPVDWYPWGEEALAKARAEDKPIFLSIGYAACHWCHVMEHESFEDAETASLLNREFIAIKVDREQRPDLDSVYMQATTSLTGSGGWPMSVFLTPQLQPFYAGTYFPPVPRYGMPAFREVLRRIAQAWRLDRDSIQSVASELTDELQASASGQPSESLTETTLQNAAATLINSYDWANGGWGAAPKFPQPMALEFLMCRVENSGASGEPIKAALHAMRSMARGGMYDVVGGGFSRYSTDAEWRVPHFEKMLYDNALLARAYLHAWHITLDATFERIAVDTLDFVQRELTDPSGGFYSSLDADSEGEEGKFYVWSKDDVQEALGRTPEFEIVDAAYGLTARGNSRLPAVLQRAMDDESLAARFRLQTSDIRDRLAAAHRQLFDVRSDRPRPATDNKVLTAWNGLMLRAFAEAATIVRDASRSQSYLATATRNGEFLLRNLRAGNRLHRTWRNGRCGDEVFLEDYGSLILGLLQLYQADFRNQWFRAARELAEEMVERFSNPDGGFYDTPDDAPQTLFRPQELQDNPTPAGNALAAEGLLELADLDGVESFRDAADRTLQLVGGVAARYPTAFASWLCTAERAVTGSQQVAILYPPGGSPAPLLDAVRKHYHSNLALAASSFPPAEDAPALLRDHPLVDAQPTAYVCRDFVCDLPTTSATILQTRL